MQAVEHGARHVPVKVMRGHIQRVGVGQQVAQAVGDGLSVVVRDANVDFHIASFLHKFLLV